MGTINTELQISIVLSLLRFVFKEKRKENQNPSYQKELRQTDPNDGRPFDRTEFPSSAQRKLNDNEISDTGSVN